MLVSALGLKTQINNGTSFGSTCASLSLALLVSAGAVFCLWACFGLVFLGGCLVFSDIIFTACVCWTRFSQEHPSSKGMFLRLLNNLSIPADAVHTKSWVLDSRGTGGPQGSLVRLSSWAAMGQRSLLL